MEHCNETKEKYSSVSTSWIVYKADCKRYLSYVWSLKPGQAKHMFIFYKKNNIIVKLQRNSLQMKLNTENILCIVNSWRCKHGLKKQNTENIWGKNIAMKPKRNTIGSTSIALCASCWGCFLQLKLGLPLDCSPHSCAVQPPDGGVWFEVHQSRCFAHHHLTFVH